MVGEKHISNDIIKTTQVCSLNRATIVWVTGVFALFSVQYCEDIWSAFEQAYVGKDPCSVPPEAYNPLINSFQQKIPCHKVSDAPLHIHLNKYGIWQRHSLYLCTEPILEQNKGHGPCIYKKPGLFDYFGRYVGGLYVWWT